MDHPDRESIGRRLEAARRAKGVTVSEAGRATRILAKHIEAMESDDFGALAAPVYAKSFLRMYARYLGLNEQEILAEYEAHYAPPPRPPSFSFDARGKLHEGTVGTAAAMESGGALAAAPEADLPAGSGSTRTVFAEKKAWMWGAIAAVGLLVLLMGVRQCAPEEEEAPAPAAGGAARVSAAKLFDSPPGVYLEPSGEITVDLR